ncbi:MAG: ornithine cyclodeaminase family protein [Planctomycetota bacterium]|nr:MAG: ornithine cyclodeaminase family protein [Planctomycetota bacterium]
MPALYLTEEEVGRLLDIDVAIGACEEAFRQLAAGEAEHIPRSRAKAKGIMLHSMSAAANYLGLVGWKSYTTTRQGANFLVGLYELDGKLAALIEADKLGQLRTGAATGVAVELMADPTAQEMGLFGAGWQAESQLAAVARTRPIKVAYVYSRDETKRTEFADRMSSKLGIDVRPADRPQDAAEELPIVVTATTSRQPVFDGSGLAEGALVCAVGSNALNRAEIDTHVVRRADNIVCDSIKACQQEAGDFVDALEKGVFDWSRAVELSDVVAGRATGRNTRDSIVLFKSVGLAIEDVALGAVALKRAREQGVGRELPF